jgi:hypothetical protein
VGWPRARSEIRLWIPGTVVLAALIIWAHVAIRPNGRLEPGHAEWHKTDFTVFTEAGAAFFDGRNPYVVTNPRGWHYLYPPLFALLVAPLSHFDTEFQVLAWFVINVGLAFGSFVEARKLWRRLAAESARGYLWIAGAALLATFLPVLDCMQTGQLGLAILYLLLYGFRLVLDGRSPAKWFWGGVVLALPAVIKLVPCLPVACLVFQRSLALAGSGEKPRPWTQQLALTAGLATGILLFLVAIPTALIGWRANLHHLEQWRVRIVTNERVGPDANFNIHSYRNQSFANAAYLCSQAVSRPWSAGPEAWPANHPARTVHPSIRVAIGLILAQLLMVCAMLGRRRDGLDQATAYGLACYATLLVSPLSWGHYYMAQAPALLFVPIWLMRSGRPIAGRFAAVCPPILTWLHYLVMPFLGGLGLLGLGSTVWFGAVSGVILRDVFLGKPYLASRSKGAINPLTRQIDVAECLPSAHMSRVSSLS